MVEVLHEKLYTYGLYTSYVIFALTTLGLWTSGLEILDSLQFVLNLYIALFLIYNFNPYSKKPVSQFGRGIAFSAGVLLLLTKGLSGLIGSKGEEKAHTASDIFYDFAKLLK